MSKVHKERLGHLLVHHLGLDLRHDGGRGHHWRIEGGRGGAWRAGEVQGVPRVLDEARARPGYRAVQCSGRGRPHLLPGTATLLARGFFPAGGVSASSSSGSGLSSGAMAPTRGS